MGFLVINGVTIDVAMDTWREEPVDVGELSTRSLAARPARARGTKVRRWTFRTTPTEMSAAEMEKLALWIEGEGQSWKFDGTLFSGNGVQRTASGTVTASATGGKFSGKATVASGSVFGVKMSNKLGKVGGWLATVHGWSLLCRRRFVAGETASGGWRDVLMHGAVNFTRGSAANPAGVTQYVDGTAAPAANLGRCFSVGLSDPYVGPHGYLTDNSAAAVDVDDFSFYPFEIPTSWIAGIAAWRALYSWSALPRVKAWGDVFEDGLDVAPVEVIGTVTAKDVTQICEGGVVKNTLRSLTVMLEEWATHSSAIEAAAPEPVEGMTLWWESDAPYYVSGGGFEVWPDLGPHTLDGGTRTTCFTTGATNPTFGDPLNGINGMVQGETTSAAISTRGIAEGAGSGPIVAAVEDVYNPVTADFTRFFLMRMPATPASGTVYWQEPTGTPWVAQLMVVGTDLTFGEPSARAILMPVDTDPHLICIVKSGTTWTVYIDNMAAAVATRTIIDNPTPTLLGNPPVEVMGSDGANASTNYAIFTYPFVFTQAQREQMLAYLSLPYRYGDSWVP